MIKNSFGEEVTVSENKKKLEQNMFKKNKDLDRVTNVSALW